MEIIDWNIVLIAVVVGAAVVSAAWLAFALGIALTRRSQGCLRDVRTGGSTDRRHGHTAEPADEFREISDRKSVSE